MSQTSSRELFRQKAVRFFCAHLPFRMKRLVHNASLGAYLEGSTSLDNATINKLNAVMALGSNDSALKLPVLLSRVIWDGKVQTHDLSQEAPQSATPDLVAQMTTLYTQATPKWLRYGEERVIRSDVEKLLSVFGQCRESNSAA